MTCSRTAVFFVASAVLAAWFSGSCDHATVWADRLPPCYGVAPALDGGPMWDRPSAPRWNLDNWYYCDGGFRFRGDGSAVEPATGTGQFGQTTTDWGDRFYIVQVQPVRYVVPLPHHYLARNPYHGAQADTQSLMPYNDVYPISKPDPWRTKRGQDPAWLKFYGEAEAIPNGFITSACGPLIYRAKLLPEEYWGNHFCCENAPLKDREAALVDAVFSRQNRLPGLLDAAEQGTISLSNLDANRCRQLEQVPDAALRSRAQALLAKQGTTASRAAVFARYQAALTLFEDQTSFAEAFFERIELARSVSDLEGGK